MCVCGDNSKRISSIRTACVSSSQGQADDTPKTSDSGPPAAAAAAAAAVEGVVKESNYVEVEGGGATLTPRTTLVPGRRVTARTDVSLN